MSADGLSAPHYIRVGAAAVHAHRLAGDKAGVIRGEKEHRGGELLHLAGPLEHGALRAEADVFHHVLGRAGRGDQWREEEPGCQQLTFTPLGPSSRARSWVSWITPALADAYGAAAPGPSAPTCGVAPVPRLELMLTIRPYPWRTMRGAAACAQKKTAFRSSASTASRSASTMASNARQRIVPALFTRMSTRRWLSTSSAMKSCRAARLVTSMRPADSLAIGRQDLRDGRGHRAFVHIP
jgi:hypothetical protein